MLRTCPPNYHIYPNARQGFYVKLTFKYTIRYSFPTSHADSDGGWNVELPSSFDIQHITPEEIPWHSLLLKGLRGPQTYRMQTERLGNLKISKAPTEK
jgi:hypothetical protein